MSFIPGQRTKEQKCRQIMLKNDGRPTQNMALYTSSAWKQKGWGVHTLVFEIESKTILSFYLFLFYFFNFTLIPAADMFYKDQPKLKSGLDTLYDHE